MKLGVAFSGGGVRSAAQLGVMQALYENGVKPNIFTGTSGGAIVATLLSLGNSPEEALVKYREATGVLDIAYLHILTGLFTHKPIQGLYKGEKLREILDRAFKGKTFYDVSREYGNDNSLAVVSTDLNKGIQVIFSSETETINTSFINDDNFIVMPFRGVRLSYAVSNSCRLPAVFVPQRHRDMLLSDGGLTNNLPADIALSLGADRVISVDLGYSGELNEEIGGIYSILNQSLDIMMERGVDANQDALDIYLNPKIYDVKVLDFHRIDECYQRGYKYGIDNIGRVKEELGL